MGTHGLTGYGYTAKEALEDLQKKIQEITKKYPSMVVTIEDDTKYDSKSGLWIKHGAVTD